LAGLPWPLQACYDAGPAGFALDRAATAAGMTSALSVRGKTPHASGDRIKTDRKTPSCWRRCCPPGS
jgi:hypothetical protein